MKISLNMFFIAVLVFLLVNGIFGALSRRHFHTVAPCRNFQRRYSP